MKDVSYCVLVITSLTFASHRRELPSEPSVHALTTCSVVSPSAVRPESRTLDKSAGAKTDAAVVY